MLRFMSIRLAVIVLLGAVLAGCGGHGHAGTGVSSGGSAPISRLASTQSGCATAAAQGAGLVMTETGPVRAAVESGTYAFKGIPYAAPPVGDLRWRNPRPPACWTDTRDGSQFGPACPQIQNGQVIGAEDCLTLNVWSPADSYTAAGPLPVLFFIHGGGNVEGSSAQKTPQGSDSYGGSALALKGKAVVVTINYRLGPLGFLANAALAAEAGQTTPGNYGIMDQIAALGWVQRNITAFGGDPARLLLFGESAGGEDTCVLLASPLAQGLFSRALIESGGCISPTLVQRERQDDQVVQAVNCAGVADTPACLRSLSPADLLNAAPPDVGSVLAAGVPGIYGPNVDGALLTASPWEILRASGSPVPLVIGTNEQETGLAAPRISTADDYDAVVRKQFPLVGAAALQQYPASSYASPRAALVALTSDARFTCPAGAFAAVASSGSQPVYRYLFTHALENSVLRSFGAWHGEEIAFLFANGIPGYTPSAGERALSDSMIGYWSRFAATGDPNGAGAVVWPRYDTAMDPYLALDDTITAGQGVHSANCAFWARVFPG